MSIPFTFEEAPFFSYALRGKKFIEKAVDNVTSGEENLFLAVSLVFLPLTQVAVKRVMIVWFCNMFTQRALTYCNT